MNTIKDVDVEFFEKNPPEVLHGIQPSWRETQEFNLSSGLFHGIFHFHSDDPFIVGPLTYNRAKALIILNLGDVPLGFTLKISSSWWNQYELTCKDCGGKGAGVLLLILQKLIVYKAPPPDSIDLETLADGAPTYVFRVDGKLRCSHCQCVVQINYPSNTQFNNEDIDEKEE
jgi:hypothetical protein